MCGLKESSPNAKRKLPRLFRNRQRCRQTFSDAFQLYSLQISVEQVDENRFTLDILNEQIGLSVSIVKILNVRYIALKYMVDLAGILIHSKQLQENKDNQQERLHVGKTTLKQITQTMDTEYDCNIAKWIFSMNMSHSQMRKVSVDPQTEKNLKIIEECEKSVKITVKNQLN